MIANILCYITNKNKKLDRTIAVISEDLVLWE